MKRYWPLYLALFCWLLVFAVPAARNGIVTAWVNRPQLASEPGANVVFGIPRAIPTYEQQRLARFPADKSIQLFQATLSSRSDSSLIENLAKRYPNDALLVALQLQNALNQRNVRRPKGLVSNPTMPKLPPRTTPEPTWDGFIALARHGQTLEPNNTYFDWMVLYGLYASYRDEEAYKVLQRASTKTGYDSHLRELVLNNLAVTKRLYSSPILPDWLMRLAYPYWSIEPLGDVAMWTMEEAIKLREKGENARALNNSYNMLRLSRLMRLNGYRISESMLGYACEENCLINSKRASPIVTSGSIDEAAIASVLLAVYAREQLRHDIAQYATAERAEMQRSARAGAYGHSWYHFTNQPATIIYLCNELQAFLLKTLPATLVLSLIFGALSWKFRSGVADSALYRRGALTGVGLLALLLSVSWYITSLPLSNVRPPTLLHGAPLWVIYGVPLLLLCTGLHLAGRWQRNQQGPAPTFRERLKNLSPNSGDGLPLSNFGWFFGGALKISYWVCLVVLPFRFYQMVIAPPNSYADLNTVVLGLLALAAGLPVGAFLFGWWHRPRRSETLRLGFRHIYQLTAGYLVAASVIHAVVALGSLPIGLNFERDWQEKFETSEVKNSR